MGTLEYDWKFPDGNTFYWEGIRPTPNVPKLIHGNPVSNNTLIIEPTRANAQFKILTDFEVKNSLSPDAIPQLTDAQKKNLQSANKYLNNLGNSSIVYSPGVPFNRVITNLPAISSIFIRSNLSVDNNENIIKKTH